MGSQRYGTGIRYPFLSSVIRWESFIPIKAVLSRHAGPSLWWPAGWLSAPPRRRTWLRDIVEKAQDRLEKATGKRPPVQISQESSGASDHVNFIGEGIPSVDFNWIGILNKLLVCPDRPVYVLAVVVVVG